MTTAGIAAASPSAVASSASAIPGATTARFVVCALDMPMKLFMMPQTVPNRPTKGAVAPMVASTPVPRRMRRPQLASMRSSRDAIRSLMPSVSAKPGESFSSVAAAPRNCATSPLISAKLLDLLERTYAGELPRCCPPPPLGEKDFDRFGEPHRPGDERGKGKPDQYRLHHRVGVEKHAPGAEVAVQLCPGQSVPRR